MILIYVYALRANSSSDALLRSCTMYMCIDGLVLLGCPLQVWGVVYVCYMTLTEVRMAAMHLCQGHVTNILSILHNLYWHFKVIHYGKCWDME